MNKRVMVLTGMMILCAGGLLAAREPTPAFPAPLVAPDGTDPYGWTPLHHAARDDAVAEVVRLANRQSVAARERHARTPLHIAATWGRVEVGEALIAADADLHAKDQWGVTPLRRAELMQQVRGLDRSDFIEMLRRHGAAE